MVITIPVSRTSSAFFGAGCSGEAHSFDSFFGLYIFQRIYITSTVIKDTDTPLTCTCAKFHARYDPRSILGYFCSSNLGHRQSGVCHYKIKIMDSCHVILCGRRFCGNWALLIKNRPVKHIETR